MDRSEEGFTMVFIALSLVAMLAASAFAIDLGQAYASRRQMQNSADAASLAGARALLKTRTSTGGFSDSTNSVWNAARDTATRNQSAGAEVACHVIRSDQTVVASCAPSSGWVTNTTRGGPAGVRVTSGVTNTTAFGAVLGKDTVTARASATALVQPLVSSTGSPFIMCGSLANGGWDILTSTGTIKPSAIYNPSTGSPEWNLQESQAKDCGAGATFKGKTSDSQAAMSVNDWAQATNGNGNDHGIYDTVAGATPCPPAGPFTNCDLVVPIADRGRSGLQLRVVTFGVFHIRGNGTGNPKYTGRLLSPTVPITRGQGGSGTCGLGQACVIKLVK